MLPFLQQAFPNLEAEGFRETSAATEDYNCLAWAAGQLHQWWWPDAYGAFFWPEGVERSETLQAFVGAYATLRYEPCNSANLETAFEKVALYLLDGKPKHAARQLQDGTWTSKLGPSIDIVHTLRGLEGPVYGSASVFLRRPRTALD